MSVTVMQNAHIGGLDQYEPSIRIGSRSGGIYHCHIIGISKMFSSTYTWRQINEQSGVSQLLFLVIRIQV